MIKIADSDKITTTYTSSSAEETFLVGKKLSKFLRPQDVLLFFGDLGAGKTTFIKGLANGFGQIEPSSVNSPTFQYLNIYSGTETVYHFDLYRIVNEEHFLEMGFYELLFQKKLICIEWAERIPEILPQEALEIHIQYLEQQTRLITFKGRAIPHE